jgi:hypothetical protein
MGQAGKKIMRNRTKTKNDERFGGGGGNKRVRNFDQGNASSRSSSALF